MTVNGVKGNNEVSVANRRLVVVDVPHGIAVGMFIGVLDTGTQKTAHEAAEIFRVVDGKSVRSKSSVLSVSFRRTRDSPPPRDGR